MNYVMPPLSKCLQVVFFMLSTAILIAQPKTTKNTTPCADCNCILRQADQFFKQGDNKNALLKYQSARACAPEKSLYIDGQINTLFKRIEKQKQDITLARDLADAARATAQQAEAEAIAARDSAKLAQKAAEIARDNAQKAQEKADKERQKVFQKKLEMMASDMIFRSRLEKDRTVSFRLAEYAYRIDPKNPKVWQQLLNVAHYDSTPIYVNFVGHHGRINTLAVSPDGKFLASGSADNIIKIWEIATQRELFVFEGHQSEIMFLMFSPDGSHLFSISDDKKAKIWNLSDKTAHHFPIAPSFGARTAAFSPKGDLLAIGGSDFSCRIYAPEKKMQVPLLPPPSPSSEKPEIEVPWQFTLKGHSAPLTAVNFSPDGTKLLTASADKLVKIWDLTTRQLLLTLSGHLSTVLSASFSPNGNTILTTASDHTARLWNSETGEEIKMIEDLTTQFITSSFSLDGQYFVLGSSNHTAECWQIEGTKPLCVLYGHQKPIFCARFLPESFKIVTSSGDATIKLWDLNPHQKRKLKYPHQFIRDLSISNDGEKIAILSGNKTAYVYDMKNFERMIELTRHEDEVIVGKFSPVANQLLTGSADKTAKLWNLDSAKEEFTFQGHQGKILDVSFSPDGKKIATASEDKTIKIWDLSQKNLLGTLEGHEFAVYSVVFSPDGMLLATASDDSTVRLWNANTMQQLHILRGHKDVVRVVRFSPNGSRLLSASFDKTAKFWNLKTMQEISTFAHQERITDAFFQQNGEYLVTVSENRELRVWSIASSKSVLSLRKEVKIADAIVSHPTKQAIIAVQQNNILFWSFSMAQLLAEMTRKQHLAQLSADKIEFYELEESFQYAKILDEQDSPKPLIEEGDEELMFNFATFFHLKGNQTTNPQAKAKYFAKAEMLYDALRAIAILHPEDFYTTLLEKVREEKN